MPKAVILSLGAVAVMLFTLIAFMYFAMATIMTRQLESPYGFIDRSGKQVIDLKSDRNNNYEVSDFYEDRAILSRHHDEKAYVINREGLKLGDTFKHIEPFSEGFAAAQPVDAALDSLEECKYEFSEKHYLWGFADKGGKLKIKANYRQVSPFKCRLAAVVPEGSRKWGFIDTVGSLKIPAKFDEVSSFSEGIAAVCLRGKWGLLDHSGNYLLKPTYMQPIRPYREGLAALYATRVINSGKISRIEITEVKYLDKVGKVALTVHPAPDLDKSFINLASLNEITSRGGTIAGRLFGPQQKSGFSFAEGLAVLRQGDKYGFINQAGNFVISPQFDYAWPFQDGLAKVYADVDGGRYSYIDHSGKLISPFIYSAAEDFSEGLAYVDQNSSGKGFFINHTGQSMPFEKWALSGNFHDGVARIGRQIIGP